MARIDDYKNAHRLAMQALAERDWAQTIRWSGYDRAADNRLDVPFLNRRYLMEIADGAFMDAVDPIAEVPIQEQVLILHYLLGITANAPDRREIAYREIPGASFYFGAFVKRAINPMKQCFGSRPQAFALAAEKLNAQPVAGGDVGYNFQVFPKIALKILLWEADDEFDCEANILFDARTADVLSPEDAAWLAGMVVYRLMQLSK